MDLSGFLMENAEQFETVEYVASKRFKDKDGNPLKWVMKPITSEHNDELKKQCTKRIMNPKTKMYQNETDYTKYCDLLAVECTVVPDLKDAKLQNDWKVMGEVALLKKMLALPGEFVAYTSKAQEICGFDFDAEVEEAKN